MPRKARIQCSGMPHHILQRGNNRAPCFFTERDYQYYLEVLAEGAERYHCRVHAYVLMANHVHLLSTPSEEDGLSRMMRFVGSRYTQYTNLVHERSGTLWEGRFRSCPIDTGGYLLTCCLYIDLNPIRAGMVINPSEYRWSSYGAHAEGRPDNLIREHSVYDALGADGAARQQAYRELSRYPIDEAMLQAIRISVNSGLVLGGEHFRNQVESILARPVRLGKPGRPKKKDNSSVHHKCDPAQGAEG